MAFYFGYKCLMVFFSGYYVCDMEQTMYSTIGVLSSYPNTGFGGVCPDYIEVVDANGGSTFRNKLNDAVSDVDLAIGANWNKIYFKKETAQVMCEPVLVDGIVAYKHTFKCKIQKANAVRINSVRRMLSKGVILKAINKNKTCFVLGMPKGGLKGGFVYDGKTNITEQEEFDFLLSAILPEPMAELQSF